MNTQQPLKMYVLLRKEFTSEYNAAQGGHAILKFAAEHPEIAKDLVESYHIHLGVRFPTGLLKWEQKLKDLGVEYTAWREPDQLDQITAIACDHTGEIFKDLRLL